MKITTKQLRTIVNEAVKKQLREAPLVGPDTPPPELVAHLEAAVGHVKEAQKEMDLAAQKLTQYRPDLSASWLKKLGTKDLGSWIWAVKEFIRNWD